MLTGRVSFSVVWRGFYLVEEILAALEELAFELFFLQVVERERNLLILIILYIVVVAQVALFLGSNHAPHQFYGRIILTF